MAATTTAAKPVKNNLNFTRFSDVALAVAIIVIVGLLIVPIPAWLLDAFLIVDLSASVVIPLVTLYTEEPLQFSVFPSLLLVMTLFRLSLDIAATKLILGSGQAGEVIQAFGSFVVGGNYVVGIIAFLILVVVQFVVITSGAGRVAEVAARFTLDAMPGKQMSIDADLNAGLINEDEARRRRKQIEAEADFYGAMDGASKFVRGDAIAAVLIIIINIVGGFGMGWMRGESDVLTIIHTYTLLTIGEGLVSQIPALLISTATGLMVTRAASEQKMGSELFSQIFAQPRPLMIASVLLLLLLLAPGFPKIQILLISGVLMGVSIMLTKADQQRKQADSKAAEAPAAHKGPENVMPLLSVEPIELELGSSLVPMALSEEGGDLADRVAAVRRQIATEMGFVMPTVRIRDNLHLKNSVYAIKIRGAVVASTELMPSCLLAMDSGNTTLKLEGTSTIEPAFGSPATWIPKAQRQQAEMAGYLVADPPSVLITHLSELVKKHASELLTRQDTQALIDHVKKTNPAVVEELIPNLMSVGEVQKILQNLLRERLSIRDLGSILEALADHAGRTKDIDQLTEFARSALARQICNTLQGDADKLSVITLSPKIEQQLRESVQMTQNGVALAMDPGTATGLIRSLSKESERMANLGLSPVLLCSSQVRLPLKRLMERSIPQLTVVAYNEIVPQAEVEAVGTVEV